MKLMVLFFWDKKMKFYQMPVPMQLRFHWINVVFCLAVLIFDIIHVLCKGTAVDCVNAADVNL